MDSFLSLVFAMYIFLEAKLLGAYKFRIVLSCECNLFLIMKCHLSLGILSASKNAAAPAKLLQSCLTLCDLIGGSPPGSSVPGILQARALEWVAPSFSNACMHAKSLQSCPTLCDPIDSSPPGSSVHGVLQARILEWVAISFSSFRDYFDTNIATLCFFWLIFATFISSFSLFCLIILDLFNTSFMSTLNILPYFLYTIFAHLLKLSCRHCDFSIHFSK